MQQGCLTIGTAECRCAGCAGCTCPWWLCDLLFQMHGLEGSHLGEEWSSTVYSQSQHCRYCDWLGIVQLQLRARDCNIPTSTSLSDTTAMGTSATGSVPWSAGASWQISCQQVDSKLGRWLGMTIWLKKQEWKSISKLVHQFQQQILWF